MRKKFTMLLALVLCAFTSSVMAQTYYTPGDRTTTLEAGKKYFISVATYYGSACTNLLYNSGGTLAKSDKLPNAVVSDATFLFTIDKVGNNNTYYITNSDGKYLQSGDLTSTETETAITVVPYNSVKGSVTCGNDVQACDENGNRIAYDDITDETAIVCVYESETKGWRYINTLQTGKSTPFAFYEAVKTNPFEVTIDLNAPIYYTIKNVRANAYAEYDGSARAMLLKSSVTSAANLFYFTAGTAGTYKIHNAATTQKCAATNSWTTDGIEWHIKQSENTTYSGFAISKEGTLTSDTEQAWNDYQGNCTSIAYWGGNDAGSVWAIEKFEGEIPAIKMSTESEKHLYFIKNDRVNKFANYVALNTKFTETAASNYGSYWYFVEKTDATDVPEGFKACYIYNAANDKPVENPNTGNMAAIDDANYPAKVYLVGTHESTYWGYVIYPQGKTNIGWNDHAGGGVTNYTYDDAGSIWSIIPADKTEAQLKSEATTAKNNALTLISHAEYADYYTYADKAIATAKAAIETVDVNNLATAVTGLLTTSFETTLATLRATTRGTVAPAVGEYIQFKNRKDNKYLKANVNDANNSADAEDLATIWFVEEGTDGNVKLKNVSTGKYIGTIRKSATVAMTDVDVAAQLSFTNRVDVYAVFKDVTGVDYAYGHVNGGNLVGWEPNAEATQWAVAQLTADEALADLQALVNSTNGKFGESVGQCAVTEGLMTALNTAENLLDANSTDVGAILDANVALQAAVTAAPTTSAAMNLPATGKYYRLQNEACGKYISGDESSITLLADGAEAKSTIFYLDENKALRAVNGKYFDCSTKGYSDDAKAGEFGFAYGGPKANVITYKNNGRWIWGNESFDTGGSVSGGNAAGYNWIITEAADPTVFEARQALSALVADASSDLAKLPLQVVNANAAYYLSSCGSADNNVEANMIDGNNNTFYGSPWQSSVGQEHYWQVDLGDGVQLSEFVFSYTTRADGKDMPTRITVLGSTDGVTFDATLGSITEGLPAAGSAEYVSEIIPNPNKYRYLRFQAYSEGGWAPAAGETTIAIAEFAIMKTVESMTDWEKGLYNAIEAAQAVLANLSSTADAIDGAYKNIRKALQTPLLAVSDLDAVSYPYALTDEQAAIVFGRENLTIAFDITTASSLAGRGAAICAADPTAGVPTTGVANNSTYVAYGHYGTWAAYFPSSKDGDRFSFDGSNGNLDTENNKFSGSTNYKVVYVIDKVNQKNSLYVNGELWGETTYPKLAAGYTLQSFSNFEVAAGHKLYIGGGVTSTSNGYDLFDGTIHSAQFFNTVLTAEEIADIEYPVTTLQQDPEFMTKADAAHSAMNIYGLQRHFGLVQDGGAGIEGNGQFECNFPASTSQEGGNAYANLIDGSYTSFFHSGYDGTRGDGSAHYLQATLSKPVKSFRFYFKKRSQNNNNRPIEILIEGSTNGDAFSEITTINTGLPTDANVLDYYSDAINTATAYKHLRFTIKKTNGDQSSGNPFFTFSEFYILPTYAKVNEAFDAVRNYRSARSISTAKALIESSVWNSVLTYGTPAIGMDHFIYADTKQGNGSYVSRYLYNKSGALATSTSLDAKNNMYVWRAAQPEGTTYFTFQNVGDEAKYIGYGNSGNGLTIHTAPVQLDIQSSYAVHAGSVGIKRIGDDGNGKFMVTAADGSSFNRNSSAVNNGSWCSDYMFVPADLYDGMFTFTIVGNTPLAEAVYVWNEIEQAEGTSALFSSTDVITDGTLKLKSCNPTYVLEGFYSDNGYINRITEVSELTENTTVYAKFVPNIFSEKYGDKWVRLSNCSDANYWATVENTNANGNGKTATLDYADEKQLWCLVGNASSFVLYNKAAGENLSLNVPLTGSNETNVSGDQALLSTTKGTWKFIEQDFGYALVPTENNNSNLGINMWAGAGGNLKVYATGAGNKGSYWTVQLADVANPLTFSVEVDKVWESSPRVAELTLTIDGASSQTRILGNVAAKKMYLPVGATFSLSSMTYRGYTFNGFGGEDSYENATLPKGGLEVTASYTANDERTLFYSPSATGHPYRIPAIATAPNGDIFAICDHRPCGADIGNGDVDIVCRISSDNGVTWGDEIVLADGDGGSTNRMETGYGDPAIVVDRESNKILVMMVAGRTVCGNSRWDASKIGDKEASLVNRAARIYGTYNEAENKWVWTAPEEVTDDIYKLFLDENNNATVTSYFIGSGKICQSRVVKKGEYYRLYCALWTRDEGNRVLYSDDFGKSWKVLGTIADRPATGGNEPKCEELPDGTVLLSSRVPGGRYFNFFTFDNEGKSEEEMYTTGSWGTVAKSTETKDGSNQGTNGEIYKVKAIHKESGRICDVMLQSVPAGPGGRYNVTVYYKEMDYTVDYSEANAPATFATGWEVGKQVSEKYSAYSTMIMQADGRIGFLFEEAPSECIIYIPYTLEDLTDEKYSLYTVTSAIGSYKIGTFYASEAMQIPEGVKAYVATEAPTTENGTSTITMTELAGIIPAHTGAVLRGEAGSYEFIPSISYGTPIMGNMLVGYEAADVDSEESLAVSLSQGYTTYVLAVKDNSAGFYKKNAGFKVYNNKAYLTVPNSSAASALRIRFGADEEATVIDPSTLSPQLSTILYDLQGRRVDNPTKGIYIVNGRKVVIR